MKTDSILTIVPEEIKVPLNNILLKNSNLQEIHLRVGRPTSLLINNDEYGLNGHGLCKLSSSMIITQEMLSNSLKYMSKYSLYTIEEELRKGYVTIEGGHRIGVTGRAVMENHVIKTLKSFSSLNIRVAHEVKGCSKRLHPFIFTNHQLNHLLIISPPKCGKTTLLRDLVRCISDGLCSEQPKIVGIVDERSEIAGCYNGVPQNDVGLRTDILDACPKVEGMLMLIRSMSPDVIAVDEIGKQEDMKAIEEVISTGVSVICTVHGSSIKDCQKKPYLKDMIKQHFFERLIVMNNKNGVGTIEGIYKGDNFEKLY